MSAAAAAVIHLDLPARAEDAVDIYLNVMVRSSNRADVIRRLRTKGVDTTSGYLRNCAALPEFAAFAGEPYPGAEELEATGFYLPVNPFLSDGDLNSVVLAVREIFQDRATV